MKIKGKLPDWRSAKSHLSFVGGLEVATKKEHLPILAQLDVPCPQLDEKDEKEKDKKDKDKDRDKKYKDKDKKDKDKDKKDKDKDRASGDSGTARRASPAIG